MILVILSEFMNNWVSASPEVLIQVQQMVLATAQTPPCSSKG